jgi:hypothetical protein
MSEGQSQRSVASSAQHRQEDEVATTEERERAAVETAATAIRLMMAELAAVRAEVEAAAAVDAVRMVAVKLKDGVMRIWNRHHRLLAKVTRGTNRLYVLNVQLAQPLCLVARRDDKAWQWHKLFRHLHFDALKWLSAKGMVWGLLSFNHVEQFCDICMLTKQRRLPFPQQLSFWAKERLKLVNQDLCDPVTPATPGGRRYFLLLIDDLPLHMGWGPLQHEKGCGRHQACVGHCRGGVRP